MYSNRNTYQIRTKVRQLTRRELGLVFGLAVVFSLITARLLDLQIWQHQQLLGQANANRLYEVKTTPPRGAIRDRFGLDLTQTTQLFWVSTQKDSLFAEENPVDRLTALKNMSQQTGQMRVEFGRTYPWGSILAQTIGYVGKPTAGDLKNQQELLSFQLLGKSGLEFSQNDLLLGRLGNDQFELSALGVQQRKVDSDQHTAGEVVSTTLDPFLSYVATKAMGDNKGAVVILDTETGEVLSLVSQPAFDPNIFQAQENESDSARQHRMKQIQDWLQNSDRPLFHRAVSGTYPPGSVFKPVTALAALENDAISAETEFNDEGVLKVGEFEYANWFFTQFGGTDGLIALQRALARSNDIYFYKAAEATGPNSLAAMARTLGFGQKTGLELSGEASGLIPDPDWKEQNIGEKWFLGNTYHMGIGQGDVLVTPLQVASLTQTIAHGGEKCTPHLLAEHENGCQGLGLNQEHLEVVMAGMTDACSPGGTAFPFFEWNQEKLSLANDQNISPWEAGAVACKTGTAEFGGKDGRGYRKTHGWFTLAVKLPDLKQVNTNFSCYSELTSKSDVNLSRYNGDQSPIGNHQEFVQDNGMLNPPQADQHDDIEGINKDPCSEKQQLYQDWLALIKDRGYPRNLIITILLESDEARPYREGSRDAAPVAKEILDWMVGKSTG